MKRTLLFALLSASVAVYGQRAKLEKADKLFNSYAFYEAAGLYERILEKEDNTQAKINLAECYRLTQDFEKAEYWYSQAVGKSSINPIFKLYYGQMLQSNGKCQEAEYWFREYARLRPEDSRGIRFEAACEQMVGYYSDEGRYTLAPLAINTPFSDFAPAFYEGGLVFVSAREDGRGGDQVAAWSGEPFLDIFYAAETDQGFREPERFGGTSLNSKHHEGPLSFSPDGQRIFFTRNNSVSESVKEENARTVRLKIFTAERSGRNNWGKVEELDFNSGDYSNSAPALLASGDVMVFSSTMPGGFGGADLYLSRLVEGAWSKPVNLGGGINTEGDEMFPFLHADSTLYFASDGHAGLGGLDVFYAETEDGSWRKTRNMGWSLNSRWDDFGLIWNEDRSKGYFASNRPGGSGGDDLYTMTHNWVRVNGLVVDAQTNEPLPGADVRVIGGPSDKNLVADEKGLFAIDLPKDIAVALLANHEGYANGRKEIQTPLLGETEQILIPLTLDRIKINIHALDSETRKPIPGVSFTWDNSCSGTSDRFESNDQGRLSMPISRSCDYTLGARVEGYADAVLPVSREALLRDTETDVFIELDPVHTGMTVELHHIYYDFDEAFIRQDGEQDLIQLAEFMRRNPGISIELGSHTDSRGSKAYNRKLSQQRAESAVAYLVKLGVEPERVVAMGYGESELRNRCSDDVPCTDQEHQFNRRTQFRITGLNQEITSTDKEQIPVNTGKRAK
jgi:outer membrane protein OmpA-like peptidoglycan-associated protein/tetratricopeptide (TPR) repeat protein